MMHPSAKLDEGRTGNCRFPPAPMYSNLDPSDANRRATRNSLGATLSSQGGTYDSQVIEVINRVVELAKVGSQLLSSPQECLLLLLTSDSASLFGFRSTGSCWTTRRCRRQTAGTARTACSRHPSTR